MERPLTPPDDASPLHLAAARSTSAQDVAALVAASPFSAARPDGLGMLPLHWACAHSAPAAVVTVLLRAYPAGISARDRAGQVPLHHAAESRAVHEVVSLMLEANPALAAEKDGLGRLPLHAAAGGQATVAVLDALHEAYPQGAWDPDALGRLPLHHAAARRAAAEGVAYLLRTYPEAAQCRDRRGRTALHLAAAKQAPPGAVKALLDVFPDATFQADLEGKVPIHYAVSRQAPAETVHLLLKAFPGGAAERSGRSNLMPLHIAAACAAPPTVIAQLISAHPEAVRTPGANGRLPLHQAMAAQAPVESVSELLAAYPEATRHADSDGMLPLHVAAEAGASPEILGQLLAVFPESARLLHDGTRPLYKWMLKNPGAPTRELAAKIFRSTVITHSAIHDIVRFPDMATLVGNATAVDKQLPYVKDGPLRRGSSPSLAALAALAAPQEPLDAACPECRRAMLLNGHLLRRYDVAPGAPAYVSSTTVVLHAVDSWAEEDSPYREVALKFVRKAPKMQREVERRTGLSADYVAPVLRTHTVAGDACFAEEAELRGVWPYMMALERGQRTLAAALGERLDAQNLMRRDWESTRRVARQLAECVQHVHAAGLVHGEVKPSNCVVVGDRWKLIDMDAAASNTAGEYISDRCSSAFCPPEMVYMGEDGMPTLKVVPERGVLEAWEPASLKASPAFDMWSFGVVLYHMIVGRPLFNADADDNLSSADLRALAAWDSAALEAKLRPLADAPLPVSPDEVPQPSASRAAAVDLLRWLLQPSPSARPALVPHVLRHRFMDPISGLRQSELAAESPSLYTQLSNNIYSAMQSNASLSAAVAAAAAPTGVLSSSLWRGMSTALAIATGGRSSYSAASTPRAETPQAQQGEYQQRQPGTPTRAAPPSSGGRGGGGGEDGNQSPLAVMRKRGCYPLTQTAAAIAFG